MQSDNLLEEAVAFAARKHTGQLRKGTKLPYIVHSMETATVCAGFTDNVIIGDCPRKRRFLAGLAPGGG